MENGKDSNRTRRFKTSQARAREVGNEQHENRERKRLRVSRACDQCRRKKDRCDGQQPVCQPCSNVDRSCTYNLQTKRRGLPAGYVRAMEILMGLVFQHVEGSEIMVSELLSTQGNVSDPRLPGRDTPSAQSLLDVWRESSVVKQMEGLLTTPDSTEEDDAFMQRLDDRLALAFSRVVDQQSASDELKMLDNSYTTAFPEDEIQPVITDLTSQPATIPQAAITGHQSSTNIPDSSAIQLPLNWSQLLDIYFAYTHCWFPISQKHDLLRSAYLLTNGNINNGDILTSGDRAFLWAVLAYTTHQCNAQRSSSDVQNGPEIKSSSSAALYALAQSLIPLDALVYEPGHVRALLILGLHQISLASWTSAWAVVGRAVYMAIDLGIIPQNPLELVDSSFAHIGESQKRTSLGCFVLDTLISTHLKRRPHLKRSDLQLSALPQLDGNEEWETWQPSGLLDDQHKGPVPPRKFPGRVLSISNQFLNLMALLNDLVCETNHPSFEIVLPTVSQSLDNWRQKLPSHCQGFLVDGVGTTGLIPPQLANLGIAYVGVVEALRMNAGLATSTSARRGSAQRACIDQLVMTIKSQIQNLGFVSLPPTFEIYLSFCNQSLALNDNLVTPDVNTMKNDIAHIHGQLRKFWRAPKSAQSDITAIGSPNSASIATTSADMSNLSQVTATQGSVVCSILPSQFSQQQDVSSLLPILEVAQPDNPLAFTAHTVVPSQFISATDFNTLSDPLAAENEDDSLFTSLAMLDSVDWTVNQSEFMHHLGFTPDFNRTDYLSFMNR